MHKKTAILYKSILGTSEQYAKWLSQDLNGDIFNFTHISPEILNTYSTIIIASGTYLRGWMPLISFLQKNWKLLHKKQIVVIAIGLKSPENPDSIKSFLKIPQGIRDQIKYFKLPGKIMSLNAENVKRSNILPVVNFIKG